MYCMAAYSFIEVVQCSAVFQVKTVKPLLQICNPSQCSAAYLRGQRCEALAGKLDTFDVSDVLIKSAGTHSWPVATAAVAVVTRLSGIVQGATDALEIAVFTSLRCTHRLSEGAGVGVKLKGSLLAD